MILMVDGIMALVLLEAIVLLVMRRAAWMPHLLAGFLLLAAMRLALGDAALPWVGACLLGAGIAHAIDLRVRW